jgi:hypothetical protein
MAISIEQKNKVNWIAVLTTFIVVVVLFVGAYFLFFKKPELVEVVVPGRFEDISKFSEIDFKPKELLNSPEFKILRKFEVNIEASTPGKSNPFIQQ